MDGYSRIHAMLTQLTATELKIAQYLLSADQLDRNLTSSNLAQKVNIGQSSVVKFTQKLGYSGFSDFKLALWGEHISTAHQTLSEVHRGIHLDDNLSTIAKKLVFEKCEVLEKTLYLNDENRFQVALKMIQNANRILLVGIGASGLVAQDFCYKLLKIGKNISYQTDAHVQLASSQALVSGDLLLAISLSGMLKEINECATQAKANGAKCLAITGIDQNNLDQIADHSLYVASKQQSIRSSAMSSRIAQMSIIDILFVGLIQIQPELAAHYIKQSRELVNKLK